MERKQTRAHRCNESLLLADQIKPSVDNNIEKWSCNFHHSTLQTRPLNLPFFKLKKLTGIPKSVYKYISGQIDNYKKQKTKTQIKNKGKDSSCES